jgi:hypothetical protein
MRKTTGLVKFSGTREAIKADLDRIIAEILKEEAMAKENGVNAEKTADEGLERPDDDTGGRENGANKEDDCDEDDGEAHGEREDGEADEDKEELWSRM